MEIAPEMQSLLEKLDALELTEGERTAFGRLLGVEGDEVEGFVEIDVTASYGPRVQGFDTGMLMQKMRVMGRPLSSAGHHSSGVVDHKAED